jgi:hypothetical protein
MGRRPGNIKGQDHLLGNTELSDQASQGLTQISDGLLACATPAVGLSLRQRPGTGPPGSALDLLHAIGDMQDLTQDGTLLLSVPLIIAGRTDIRPDAEKGGRSEAKSPTRLPSPASRPVASVARQHPDRALSAAEEYGLTVR